MAQAVTFVDDVRRCEYECHEISSSRTRPHLVALLRAVSNRCDNRIMTIARKVVGDD